MRFYRVVQFGRNDRTIQPQRPLDLAAMTAQYHGSLQTQKTQPLAGLKQMIFDFVTAKVKKFMTSRYICPNKPFRHEKDNHMLHPLRKGSSAGRNTGSLTGSSLHPPDISAGKNSGNPPGKLCPLSATVRRITRRHRRYASDSLPYPDTLYFIIDQGTRS